MKNKKLLTRLFALLASLVLVLALALPCFAEETEQPPTDYIYKRVYSYQELVLLFEGQSGYYSGIAFENVDFSAYFTCTFYYHSTLNRVDVSWSCLTLGGYYVYSVQITDQSLNYRTDYYPFDGSQTEIYSDVYVWDDLQLYVLVPVSSSSADPTTPSSDMYSNLFNILKDAVYGSDAELTGSQEYALTLISTILTYATILLPVILVIFIAVWCFKRF